MHALTLACSPTPDSTCNAVQRKVRAALLVDPNNADLIKLEADLKDIIALSSELEEKPSKIHWKVVSVLARDRQTDRQTVDRPCCPHTLSLRLSDTVNSQHHPRPTQSPSTRSRDHRRLALVCLHSPHNLMLFHTTPTKPVDYRCPSLGLPALMSNPLPDCHANCVRHVSPVGKHIRNCHGEARLDCS
jgi:hypothetical protein